MLHGLTSPWIPENPLLTHNYQLNHVDMDLWSKIQENVGAYGHTSAQSGPLIFIIMMRRLQANSQLVVTSLCSKLKAINIKDYDEEAMMHSGQTFLQSQIDCHNGVVRLLKFYQTTSNRQLNGLFCQEHLDSLQKSLTQGLNAHLQPNTIPSTANIYYTIIGRTVAGLNCWQAILPMLPIRSQILQTLPYGIL